MCKGKAGRRWRVSLRSCLVHLWLQQNEALTRKSRSPYFRTLTDDLSGNLLTSFSTFSRRISSDSLECSRLVENGLQVTRSAEGRDAHHPRLRQADAKSLKDSPQRQHQQQDLLHPTANDNELLGKSSRDNATPRGSRELGDRTPPDTEGKVSGLAEDAAAPSTEEWFGEILPLQPGEAVGDPRDGHRRAKVRYVFHFLKNGV